MLTGKGLLGAVAAPMRAFVKSREGLEAPDLLLGWVPMLTELGPKGPFISKQQGFTCYAHPMRPESRGKVYGLVYSGLDVGAAIAPVLLGWQLDHGWHAGMLAVVGVMLLMAIATVFQARSLTR
jgi:MFS family permease